MPVTFLTDEDEKKFVKTVNGIAPDENGNVQIPVSGGNADQEQITTAINTALAQAKASGEFDGKDGVDGKDGQDGYTPQKGVDYFDGKDGYTPVKGVDYDDGKPGDDYVITPDDYEEIAEMAAGLVEVLDDDHINQLINTALGVIENGTY
jgi:hypothetical protein